MVFVFSYSSRVSNYFGLMLFSLLCLQLLQLFAKNKLRNSLFYKNLGTNHKILEITINSITK